MTNEELVLANEELQTTNEELETTNDELRACTSELQGMIQMLDYERTQLLEMVELASFTVIVLRGPHLLVSAVEVTEQALDRQKAEELNHLKDEFLSLVSHELRTPLTTIQRNAQLVDLKLQQRAEKTDSSDQYIQMVECLMRQARRLDALIDELKDANRIQDDVLVLKNEGDVDLVEVTRRVIDAYAATGREIKLENTENALTGNWDEDRLEQVLHNLLSNAIKYSLENTSVNVRLQSKDNEAVVSIKDQGQGLSQQEQERIFDRYYRLSKNEKSKVDGLGLGLYIVQNIIIRSDGRIWVESKPGEGSTFSFTLPLKKADD